MVSDVNHVIGMLEKDLQAHLKKVADTKRTINHILELAGQPPRYKQIDDEDKPGVANIRGDQFYGRPLATAVRMYLEMRRVSNLGPASIAEIHEALVAGGYEFETKNDANAKRGLRISMSKNTATFHKLPTGQYGLLDWYPEKKAARERGQATESSDNATAEAEQNEQDMVE